MKRLATTNSLHVRQNIQVFLLFPPWMWEGGRENGKEGISWTTRSARSTGWLRTLRFVINKVGSSCRPNGWYGSYKVLRTCRQKKFHKCDDKTYSTTPTLVKEVLGHPDNRANFHTAPFIKLDIFSTFIIVVYLWRYCGWQFFVMTWCSDVQKYWCTFCNIDFIFLI